MRPITVTVGPLASASANNICATQTPSAGKALVLNGTLATNTFAGTGSIASNVLTITAVTSGVLTIGSSVTGSGVAPNTIVMGPLGTTTNGIGTYVVNVSQTVSSTTIYGGAVATMDTPRRVLLTPSGNESSNTFTITGTGWNNEVIVEILAGGNATATYSAMDFRTVTQIVSTSTAAGSLTVGTNTVASSQWVRLDEYAPPSTSIQVTVSGTISFTLQQAVQDVNSPFANVSPYQVTWINSADPAMVAASQSAQSSYTYSPLWAKVTLNSGSGSLSSTFSQNASSSF